VDFPDFQPALFAATVMNAFDRPWCLCGGWGIDLWLRRVTRGHADLGVAVLREDQAALRAFLTPAWRFAVATRDGGLQRLAPGYRQLLMLPVETLHATDSRGRRVDFLLNESDSLDWIYRRDARVRWPLDQWTLPGAFGVPVLAPQITLLYKSTRPRPQDELDFRSALPDLAYEQKQWLADAVRFGATDHPWLAKLR
jgi:hypothetical protein